MSIQTFACPACGSQKTLENPQPGEKLHCTCGMSFPASPVFAVATPARGSRLSGTGWAVGVAALLLIGSAGVAAYLMTRPVAAPPEHSGHQVAVTPTPGPDEAPNPTPTTNPPPPPDTPTSNPPPPPPPPPPPMPVVAESISAVTLWDAFDLDRSAADTKYTGKLLEVTGRGKVATDSFGRPFFGAEAVKPRGKTSARLTPEERRWEKEGYPPSVRCYLAPGQREILEKLPADREVVLRGTCTGRKDRQDVYRGYIVELENCSVVVPK